MTAAQKHFRFEVGFYAFMPIVSKLSTKKCGRAGVHVGSFLHRHLVDRPVTGYFKVPKNFSI